MTVSDSIRRRAIAWGALLLAAVAPFVLVCCKGEPAAAPAAPVVTASVTITVTETIPPADAAPPPEPPAAPEPLAPYKGPLPQSCRELDRALDGAFDDRACTTDADCATAARDCGCAGPIARRAVPKFEATREAYRKKDCAHRGPPRPCASCPVPPRTACKAGQCEPVR
jgi:hypothetical protein